MHITALATILTVLARVARTSNRDHAQGEPGDKLGAGPLWPTDFDKWLRNGRNWSGAQLQKWVSYHEAYERHFGRFRGTSAVVVEIGIKDGGSLKLWREYFGAHAFIIGADLFEGASALEHSPFHGHPDRIVIGDQRDEAFWSDLKQALPQERLDILIDDGSHTGTDMIKSLETTLPMLREGGVYFCEDVHGAASDFARHVVQRFVYNPKRPNGTLNAFALPITTRRPRANQDQRDVFSLSFYPFAVVVERMVQPRQSLEAPLRGTLKLNGSREHPPPLKAQRATREGQPAELSSKLHTPATKV